MDPFFRYLEDNYRNSSIPVSTIVNLKRKWDKVAEFSDCDEDQLIEAADNIENEYMQKKRRKIEHVENNPSCHDFNNRAENEDPLTED